MKDIPHFDVSDRHLAARKLVCGMGINDAPYVTQPKVDGKTLCCPYYRIWTGMLARGPTLVCQEWLSFMTFRDWAVLQDCRGYVFNTEVLSRPRGGYHPNTCAFILPSTANLVKGYPESFHMHGVDKHQGRWRATCHGKYLGHFDREWDARAMRCRAKAGLLVDASLNEKDPRVINRLTLLAAALLNVPTT